MKRTTRWLMPVAVMVLAACQLTGLPSAPATATVAISFPTTTPVPTVIPTPTVTPPPTATAVPTAIPGGQSVPGCAVAWFFTFRPGQSEPGCPEPPVVLAAVGEDFVGGRVYRYGPTPDYPDQRGTVFVIYNDGTWETRVDTFAPGDPASDPSIAPPAGRFQPTGAIGKVWRENKDVRAALGWAYGPEQPFTGRYQNPQGSSHNIYVDHGKGLVLRLVSVDMGPRTWKVAGEY